MTDIKILLWILVALVEISSAHSHLVLLSFLGLLEDGILKAIAGSQGQKM